MREIKFRGMVINGEWYYGNLSIIKKESRAWVLIQVLIFLIKLVFRLLTE